MQVYPGPDGTPLESLRLMAFHHAMQDLRALSWCESLLGREGTMALLEEGKPAPLTLEEYPMDGHWLLTMRQRVNQAIRDKRNLA